MAQVSISISKKGGSFCILCGLRRLLSTFSEGNVSEFLESLGLNGKQILQGLKNEASIKINIDERLLKS